MLGEYILPAVIFVMTFTATVRGKQHLLVLALFSAFIGLVIGAPPQFLLIALILGLLSMPILMTIKSSMVTSAPLIIIGAAAIPIALRGLRVIEVPAVVAVAIVSGVGATAAYAILTGIDVEWEPMRSIIDACITFPGKFFRDVTNYVVGVLTATIVYEFLAGLLQYGGLVTGSISLLSAYVLLKATGRVKNRVLVGVIYLGVALVSLYVLSDAHFRSIDEWLGFIDEVIRQIA